MRKFIFRINSHTVHSAKNRLKSVIINDRMNVSEDMTLEKIRKEVSAVLSRYAHTSAQPPEVSVTCQNGTLCMLSAVVPIKKERDNIR